MKNILFVLLLLSAPVSAQEVIWTYCAAEDEVCYLDGTLDVRYGAEFDKDGDPGAWSAIQTHTNSVDCDNNQFGDPLYLTVKYCEKSDGVIVVPPEDPVEPEPIRQSGTIDFGDCEHHQLINRGTGRETIACTDGYSLVAYSCGHPTSYEVFCYLLGSDEVAIDVILQGRGAEPHASMKCCALNP